MTDEEIAEYNRLCDEYERLVRQNAMLHEEIEVGISNCYIVASNMVDVGSVVTKNVKYVSGELNDANDIVDKLHELIIDLTEHYFLFKNMSEASKKLTSYTDEYNNKFRFYNELRRITLGYVIGLDSYIVSNEALRKKVEKSYLSNTDYWLSYAIMAVMLWASNEQEAAYRALNKALTMDCYKSCVFFMLINLRFSRINPACNWFITLLDKTDVNNMGDEWQYVLHAYLIGAMKGNDEFHDMVSSYFDKLMDQTVATSADFNKKVSDKARAYAESYIHITDKAYPTMNEISQDYSEMKKLLSDMEKIGELSIAFDDIYRMDDDFDVGIFEQIENILYNLINGYDEQEFKVIKILKQNEAIMAAKGDMQIANQKYHEQYSDIDEQKTFGDLMIKWAFTDDYRETGVTIRKFALSHLKNRISKGMVGYFEDRYASVKEKYKITIDLFAGESYDIECNESDYEPSAEKICERYQKKKTKFILADKFIKIFAFMGIGALLILAAATLMVKSSVFPVLIVLGIVLGVVSGFLIWRRVVDLGKELEEKCRLSLLKLQNTLCEMREWRKQIHNCYGEIDDLKDAIERF